MLATLNLGEPHWSMDTGGFFGNPTSEEYARWVEFAAFTPILRVHASHDQKRQPWVFGPVAEAAAAKAIRLRYSLLPYIYSAERTCFESGIGVARPLEWIFPEDATAAQQTDEWMFGHALLVAPVLDLKSDVRKVYLPAGGWLDYATGKRYPGQETAVLRTDARNWADLPLFVREGSILASEEPGDDTDAMHPAEITLDVFPSRERAASFTAYEDDGATYQYEKGAYRKQSIRAAWTGEHLVVELDAPEGNFAASVRTYLLRVHVTGVAGAAANGGPAWTVGEDRFGKFVERRVKAGVAARLDLAPIR